MKSVNLDVEFPKLEEEVLSFWRDNKIFERSTAEDAPTQPDAKATGAKAKKEKRKPYVFYDGPPFATGLPHYGHLLAGTIKDVVGRFFTMKGYHVDRRFGWDCHGVPVEFEIQKALNLHGAKAIREFGVGKFNEECRKIVLRYTEEWKTFVERSGRWVDFNRQYRTMDKDYMESIWWVVKCLWDRGLIYKSVKCVPYSPAINTPLSNFEANLNYKNVQDPAITVKARVISDVKKVFKLSKDPAFQVSAYIWTTTPWTLPSNMAFAVGPELEYVLVEDSEKKETVILAKSRLAEYFPQFSEAEQVEGKKIIGTAKGSALEGLEYEPFFSYFEKERSKNAFRIYADNFVSAEDGTGIVHCASFGEDDLRIFLERGISIIDPVDEDGKFTPEVSDFVGLHVKEADSKIIASLKDKGLLVTHKTIEHSYPFCWRTDTPLIYKAISSWFVKVEAIRDLLIANNQHIRWVPEHLRDGRFGKWLEGARDWAISRNRFWGTPIPIWSCEKCKTQVCIGSVADLEKLTGAKVNDLHSHFIDELTFSCESCQGTMRRIPEVLDCWFESGAMPYAQVHYPFENKESFEGSFPADFIAEGLDQTRGWFYTLIVLSTALFGREAFKNVIVNGIVLAEDGKKMSKSLRNYPPPDEVMNEFGADAMRLYLLSSAATRAEDLRFSKGGVKQVVRQTLLPLWNSYNFFVTYALVDSWTPAHIPQKASENLLDRWILSKLASLVQGVDTALSNYRLYLAAPPILEFVDQLTNWYIRLNRRRFWGQSAEQKADTQHAYATLHKTLVTFVQVLAPLAPFISEEIFKNLSSGVKGLEFDSVHLAPFPSLQELKIDLELEEGMETFEEIILLGRSLRNELKLKVRQPLAKLTVIHADNKKLANLKVLDLYIKEELNVKEVVYTDNEGSVVTLQARLNTKKLGKVLGPKLGSDGMKRLRDFVEGLSSEKLAEIERGGKLAFDDLELTNEDVLIERKTREGADASATSGQITITLDTILTPELEMEGLAREFVNRVQNFRKDFNFDVSDRVVTKYMTACEKLSEALTTYKKYVMDETLSLEIALVANKNELDKPEHGGFQGAEEIEGKAVVISLTRIQA